MWQLWAAIGAAAANHLGTMMSAKGQKAPDYAGDIDLSETQLNGLQANYANSPEIEALVRQINNTNQQDNLAALEAAIPGYSSIASTLSQNASNAAGGVLTAEQSQNMARTAAERSVSTGIGGQAGGYSLLKDYGLAQLQGTQWSQNIMNSLAQLSKTNLTSMDNFYTNSDDWVNTAESNRSAKQAWLNAKQASDNVSKNAIWGQFSAAANSYTAMKSGQSPSAAQNQYQYVNYAYQG